MSKKGLITDYLTLKRKQTDTGIENKKRTKEIPYIPMEIVNEIMSFHVARTWVNIALVNKEWRDTFLKFSQREKDFFDAIIKSTPPDVEMFFRWRDPRLFPYHIVIRLAMITLNTDLLKYVCHDEFFLSIHPYIHPEYVGDNVRIEYSNPWGGFCFEYKPGMVHVFSCQLENISDKITMTDVFHFYFFHISNMIKGGKEWVCLTMEPKEKKFLCAYVTRFYNIPPTLWGKSVMRKPWTDLHNEVTGLLK